MSEIKKNSISFFKNLFQRRVPQILGLYFGTCWVVIEFLNWFVTSFGSFPKLPQFVFIVMLSLIPTVVIVAYYHGKPGRDKWAKFEKIGISVNLLVIVVLFTFIFWNSAGQKKIEVSVRSEESSVESESLPSLKRVAVLPFANIRPDPQTDFLGFALADQIIGSLSYLKNILVRPSSSIRRYQNQTLDRETAGTDLEVDIVLTGNYLKEANTIRLNVELVDVEVNELIWREPIEVEYENTFSLQDIVAEKIIDRLKLQFSHDERARMRSDVSQNPLAYEYYLRALSYPEEAEGNRLAVNMLRQSVELDSTFAPAWGALGRRTQLMGYWELGGKEVSNQAKIFYLKAIEINPELFKTLAHLTMLYTELGETDLAMKTAQRTLEINPNSAEGMFAYGYVLRYAGMIEESMTAMTAALKIDPTNPTFKSAFWTFGFGGRYDAAIEVSSLAPPALRVAWEGEIAIRRGQVEEARAKWSQAVASDPEGIAGLWATGMLSALNGDYGRGLKAAHKWEDANLPDVEGWFFLAGMYCLNGETDKCISMLDTAVARGYFAYPPMLTSRFLDPARGNPGLDAVLEKARLKHEAFKEKFFSE